jgi:hypothetical protein
LSQLRGLLSEQGILALNFVAFFQDGRNATLASIARTIAQVFSHHSVFVSEPGKDFNDFIFLASSNPIDLGSTTLDAGQAKWLKNRSISLDEAQGVILTEISTRSSDCRPARPNITGASWSTGSVPNCWFAERSTARFPPLRGAGQG